MKVSVKPLPYLALASKTHGARQAHYDQQTSFKMANEIKLPDAEGKKATTHQPSQPPVLASRGHGLGRIKPFHSCGSPDETPGAITAAGATTGATTGAGAGAGAGAGGTTAVFRTALAPAWPALMGSRCASVVSKYFRRDTGWSGDCSMYRYLCASQGWESTAYGTLDNGAAVVCGDCWDALRSLTLQAPCS